jgi:predicted nucleic acid-binding protein
LIGADHPHKTGARRLLEAAISARERLVTDAEVLQEILHRYTAIKRPDAIAPAFETLLAVVDDVFPIELRDTQRAKEIILAHAERVSARDALHLATMEAHDVSRIMSFAADFDRFPSVERVVPGKLV